MLKTLASTVESKKFVVMFLTGVAGIVARWGFQVDVATIVMLMAPFMVAVGAQGWADNGKEAARMNLAAANAHLDAARINSKSQAGFARFGVMILISMIGLGVLMAPSCSGTTGGSVGPVIGNIVVDCIVKNGQAVSDELQKLKDEFNSTGSWSAVENQAKVAGMEIGGCALAELVQDFLGGRTAPSKEAGQSARATLEDFRTTVANGATFHTPVGDL